MVSCRGEAEFCGFSLLAAGGALIVLLLPVLDPSPTLCGYEGSSISPLGVVMQIKFQGVVICC